MQSAVEEVHRKLVGINVGVVRIELEPRSSEMIDERPKAAAAAHRPIEQQVVGSTKDPLIPEQLVSDALQCRARDLTPDEMHRADSLPQASLNTAISRVDRVRGLTECLVDSDGRVEVAQDTLKVLGPTEKCQILGCQTAIVCVLEQRSVVKCRPDIDTETVAAQQRGFREARSQLGPRLERSIGTRGLHARLF